MANGTVVHWTYADNVSLLVLKHKEKHFQKMEIIKNLRGFFSLRTSNSSLSFQFKNMPTKISSELKQFPVVTAFAITGHKTQGATIKNILISGFGPHAPGKSGWLYVVLSLVNDLKNIFLLKKLVTNSKGFKIRKDVVKEDLRLLHNSSETENKLDSFMIEIKRRLGNI